MAKKKPDVPLAVAAACSALGFEPGKLKGYRVTDVDVFLTLPSGMEIRVEISSLPAPALVYGSVPEPSPAPVRAQKGGKRPAKARKTTRRRVA